MFNLLLKFFKYSLVGLINTSVCLLVILILTKWSSLNVYFINITGYIVGVLNSFVLNRYWTFKKKDNQKNQKKIQKEFFHFIIVFIIAYSIQFFCLWLLVELGKIPELFSQFIAMGIYAVVGFLLNNRFTFQQKKE